MQYTPHCCFLVGSDLRSGFFEGGIQIMPIIRTFEALSMGLFSTLPVST